MYDKNDWLQQRFAAYLYLIIGVLCTAYAAYQNSITIDTVVIPYPVKLTCEAYNFTLVLGREVFLVFAALSLGVHVHCYNAQKWLIEKLVSGLVA